MGKRKLANQPETRGLERNGPIDPNEKLKEFDLRENFKIRSPRTWYAALEKQLCSPGEIAKNSATGLRASSCPICTTAQRAQPS